MGNNDIDKLTYKDITINGIKQLREKSVIVYLPDGEEKVIPRSCLSYQCDKKLEDLTFDVTKIQVVDWFCQKEDLDG